MFETTHERGTICVLREVGGTGDQPCTLQRVVGLFFNPLKYPTLTM